MGEETEDSQAIVAGHEHASVRRPFFTVHFGLETPAGRIAAAVDPECDRKFGAGLARCGSPYVQVKAVFAEVGIAVEEELRRITAAGVLGLPGRRAPGIGYHDAFPGNHRLWLLPSQFSHRGRRERNAAIDSHACSPRRHALYLAALDGKDGILIRTGRQTQDRRAKQQESSHLNRSWAKVLRYRRQLYHTWPPSEA